MANTGFVINDTVRQYFTSGPNSGSTVNTGSDIDLTVSPFSASLNEETFYNRVFNPLNCPEGFETCLSPLLTGVNTGSLKGKFELSYVTQSGFNPANAITASVSNDINFSTFETFSGSIGGILPITSSYVSGTIYFKAFVSCSGPDPSPESDLLSYTYAVKPPPLPPTSTLYQTSLTFRNGYTSPMLVEIRSLRENINYIINPGEFVSYTYYNNFRGNERLDPEDLTITIKGGANSTNGNVVYRDSIGNFANPVTGGGFDSPLVQSDNPRLSNTFEADTGITFQVLGKTQGKPYKDAGGIGIETTFILFDGAKFLQRTGTTRGGSLPYRTKEEACNDLNANYREKSYGLFGSILYEDLLDSFFNRRLTLPYEDNYIIISRDTYIKVSKNGFITEINQTCTYSTIDLFSRFGSYPTEEEACRRTKTPTGGHPSIPSIATYTIKGGKLINIFPIQDGRYPIYDGSLGKRGNGIYKGGTNAIIANGSILAIETCGDELTPIVFSAIGFTNEKYPLETPELVNPKDLERLCNYSQFRTFYESPLTGIIYYDTSGDYPYIPASGDRWYKKPDGTFVQFEDGLISKTANPCNV